MSQLPDLLAEYGEVAHGMHLLERRREELRLAIEAEMSRAGLRNAGHNSTRAQVTSWFKLTPRRDEVLGLLQARDLLPFAHFTPSRVKELLVPVYGRERLLPLFDIEKRDQLRITTGATGAARAGPRLEARDER